MAAKKKVFQVDMAALAKPISDIMPAGENLRRSVVFDRIKEARRADDPSLSQGIWKTEVKVADWRKVTDLCSTALQEKSKDLWIISWMTEAWLELYGPSGMAQGFRLIEATLGEFWDTVYPLPDEDGELDARLAPLGFINDKMFIKLKGIPLTSPSTKEPQIFSFLDWERASVMDRAGKRGGSSDQVTTSQFTTAILLTPASFFVKLEKDLTGLLEATEAVEQVLDKRAGRPLAVFWQFRETIKAVKAFVTRALDQKAEDEPPSEEADADGDGERALEGAQEKVTSGGGTARGPIKNRAEAYQRLAEAADYLMRVEPHSPTPHLVRRAVNWGNLTFAELIMELVQDKHDLQSIYGLLGLEMPGK